MELGPLMICRDCGNKHSENPHKFTTWLWSWKLCHCDFCELEVACVDSKKYFPNGIFVEKPNIKVNTPALLSSDGKVIDMAKHKHKHQKPPKWKPSPVYFKDQVVEKVPEVEITPLKGWCSGKVLITSNMYYGDCCD